MRTRAVARIERPAIPRRLLTADEHRATGPRLDDARRELQAVASDLTSRGLGVAAVAAKAVEAVDQLRRLLDDQLQRDHPAAYDFSVYYPRPAEAQPE